MLFDNQFPDDLEAELNAAENLGVKPIEVGGPEFDEAINEGEGTIKWAVTREEQLLVVPKYRYGQEISHAVLSSGEPVLAAGEAQIAGSNGQYLMLEISNRSGHFLPSEASIELGKELFRRQGINPKTAITFIE